MKEYQKKYIENTSRIAVLSDFYALDSGDFSLWYQKIREARKEMQRLREENLAILEKDFFPALDSLYDASEQDLKDLEEFGDACMDWTTNLDVGIYTIIHESLLSMARYHDDRNEIIKELYKFGMGLYYLNRMALGLSQDQVSSLYFENEMVFTEAGSYIRYFDQIAQEDTKGYIIRSLANVAITSADRYRRVTTTSRIIQILKDEEYRSQAPGLPWDNFLRRSYQQMSANRASLRQDDLSKDLLEQIMEACQIVFAPEEENDNPNIRWLWPYYEMEYTCGFVDLNTTLSRLEKLIEETPADTYDNSGIYALTTLPIYYGRLMRDNPNLTHWNIHVRKLRRFYDKMMQHMLHYPAEKMDEYVYYAVSLIATDYFETEGVQSYHDILLSLMRRFRSLAYIDLEKTSSLMLAFTEHILNADPAFFDDIPFCQEEDLFEEKKRKLLQFARECPFFAESGLMKMRIDRISLTRNMLEREFAIYKLHTLAAFEDLSLRESTRIYADVALGHHLSYNGVSGYPEQYERLKSPYRQMSDLLLLCEALLEEYEGDFDQLMEKILQREGTDFSPILTAYLNSQDLMNSLRNILEADETEAYHLLYQQITNT